MQVRLMNVVISPHSLYLFFTQSSSDKRIVYGIWRPEIIYTFTRAL